MSVVPSLVISASDIVKTPVESNSASISLFSKSAIKLPNVLELVIVIL